MMLGGPCSHWGWIYGAWLLAPTRQVNDRFTWPTFSNIILKFAWEVMSQCDSWAAIQHFHAILNVSVTVTVTVTLHQSPITHTQ